MWRQRNYKAKTPSTAAASVLFAAKPTSPCEAGVDPRKTRTRTGFTVNSISLPLPLILATSMAEERRHAILFAATLLFLYAFVLGFVTAITPKSIISSYALVFQNVIFKLSNFTVDVYPRYEIPNLVCSGRVTITIREVRQRTLSPNRGDGEDYETRCFDSN